MHQIGPHCVSNFKIFPGVIPPDPHPWGGGHPRSLPHRGPHFSECTRASKVLIRHCCQRIWSTYHSAFGEVCTRVLTPEYISELYFPIKLRPSRYQLRSSQSNQLIVPPVKLSTYGPRSFAVAGPTIWNNLPEYLRDPELWMDNFRRQLKTFLFAQYWRWHPSALETLVPVHSINLLFTLHYITPCGISTWITRTEVEKVSGMRHDGMMTAWQKWSWLLSQRLWDRHPRLIEDWSMAELALICTIKVF